MQKLTIGRMAKLYGLHRSTLYEAVERGRVTAGFNGQGQRVIDLSEMIRVYGEAPGQARHNPTPSPDTPDTTGQAMLEELQAMRRELVALREEVAQLRALPAPRVDEGDAVDTPRERPEKPQGRRKADTPADDPAPNWRSLVDALRKAEE